jgi:hypothetical protein
MRISPTAMGTEVVPTLMRSESALTPGNTAPSVTPTAIARKIHTVK